MDYLTRLKVSLLSFSIILVISPLPVLAEAQSGGQPGSFLHLGQSARALGMGNAFVAIADEVPALYYNPAGLNQLLKYELNSFYAPLWEDTNYNFLGYAHPLEKMGTLALGMVNLTSGGFQKRETIESEPVGFSIIERAFFLGYGYTTANRLSLGTTIKTIQKNVAGYSGSAFGIDAGALYKFLGSRFTVGVNFQNLMAPAPKLKEEEDKHPLYSKFGVAYKTEFPKTARDDRLIVAADIDYSSYILAKNHFGVEYWYNPVFAARMGKDIQSNVTFGFGVNVAHFIFDYAMAAHDLGVSHRFGLTYRFGYIGEAQYSKDAIKEKVIALDQSGIELYNARKYALALAEWEKALVWDPQNKEIQDKVNQVSAELETIVNRKLIEQHLSRAYVLFEEGKLVDSMEEWREVARLDPANERVKEYIVKINEKLAKDDQEILKEREKEKEIVKINSLIKNGDAFVDKGIYNEALLEYQKALAINPEHLTANKKISDVQIKIKAIVREHYDRGEQFYKNGERGNAAKEFWTVLRFDPANAGAKEFLDRIKQDEKRTPKVNKADEKRITNLYYKAADLYLRGKYQEAISACNEVLLLDPANDNAMKLVSKAQSVMEAIAGK